MRGMGWVGDLPGWFFWFFYRRHAARGRGGGVPRAGNGIKVLTMNGITQNTSAVFLHVSLLERVAHTQRPSSFGKPQRIAGPHVRAGRGHPRPLWTRARTRRGGRPVSASDLRRQRMHSTRADGRGRGERGTHTRIKGRITNREGTAALTVHPSDNAGLPASSRPRTTPPSERRPAIAKGETRASLGKHGRQRGGGRATTSQVHSSAIGRRPLGVCLAQRWPKDIVWGGRDHRRDGRGWRAWVGREEGGGHGGRGWCGGIGWGKRDRDE